MNVDEFFIFSLGFYLFVIYLVVNENRRKEARKDYRDDLAYSRTLNERREFGYKKVEDSIAAARRRFKFK